MDLSLDAERVARLLCEFLREETTRAGVSRLVVGLSGGVDSTTSLLLSVRAVGKENVLAVRMPYRTSSPESLDHAKLVADLADCAMETLEITEQIDAYFRTVGDADRVRRGNKMARERMSILYDLSRRDDALVVGTSNKTETLLGYGTLFGDTACALNPLGDMYKTQVRQLATHIGVPDVVISKVPSADLWHGQTDEDELGFSYDDVDQMLCRYVDLGHPSDRLIADGFDPAFVTRVVSLIKQSHYKRRLPLIARVTHHEVDSVFPYTRA